MESELEEVIKQIAKEEGITFQDALIIAVKTLRYEIQRRKSFSGESSGGNGRSIF